MTSGKLLAGILTVILCVGASLCGCRQSAGTFLSLREAYESGYLTKEEIRSIAFHHNGGRAYNEDIMDEDYAPLPMSPAELSESVALQIREDVALSLRSAQQSPVPEASADDVCIAEYCGTYGDCVAVMTKNVYVMYTDAEWCDEVAGVSIYYSDGNSLKIWRNTLRA